MSWIITSKMASGSIIFRSNFAKVHFCERDSSGTTVAHETRSVKCAKVMERIARREHPTHQRCGGAKRLAQRKLKIKFALFFNLHKILKINIKYLKYQDKNQPRFISNHVCNYHRYLIALVGLYF
jgi:hypothetical protein